MPSCRALHVFTEFEYSRVRALYVLCESTFSVMYIIWLIAYAVLVAADRNCRINGLSDTLEIPGTAQVISVGERLARTDSSYICKVKEKPDWLIKIERKHYHGNNSLQKEAAILAEIQHLNLSPKVYWEGVSGGKPLLVFEYMHGPTLYDYFSSSYKKKTHFWKNELILFGIKQIQMLRILHEQAGYIHGDTHASNWIVLSSGELKLIDFGRTVKVTSLTGRNYYYAPPLHWMLSPWEINWELLDKRDDIYRAIIGVINILNSGTTSKFFDDIAADKPGSLRAKLTDRDLVDPNIPPGPLTRLIQSMQPNTAPPYLEIIALLKAMIVLPQANKCSVLGLPRDVAISKYFVFSESLTVGDRLSDDEASVIVCKVENRPELLLKINSSEGSVLKVIDHLNIAPKFVWEGHLADGNSVLVVEISRGRTLDKYQARYLTVDGFWNKWIQMGIEMIQILEKFHQYYIHCDLNASSWYVQSDGVLKLFKVDKAISVARDALSPAVSQSNWMKSPWERPGALLDKRDDVYRTILLISDLLTGGQTRNLLGSARHNFDLFGIANANGKYPSELSAIVQGMLPDLDPPYARIIELLQSMKKTRDATSDVSLKTIAYVSAANDNFVDMPLSPKIVSVAKRDAMTNIFAASEIVASPVGKKLTRLKRLRNAFFGDQKADRSIFGRVFKKPVEATN